MSNKVETATVLTKPGNSDEFFTGMSTHHTITANVSDIKTTVILRIEGTIDGETWFNLDSGDSDLTVYENGLAAFTFVGMLHKLRGVFVSETGGTGAKVVFSYLG